MQFSSTIGYFALSRILQYFSKQLDLFDVLRYNALPFDFSRLLWCLLVLFEFRRLFQYFSVHFDNNYCIFLAFRYFYTFSIFVYVIRCFSPSTMFFKLVDTTIHICNKFRFCPVHSELASKKENSTEDADYGTVHFHVFVKLKEFILRFWNSKIFILFPWITESFQAQNFTNGNTSNSSGNLINIRKILYSKLQLLLF